MTDFSNLANMKLSDFENIGQTKYNEGFRAALLTVTKLLQTRICEDYNADGMCEHEVCPQNQQLVEGLDAAIGNLG
jgi:hypothetical protein